MDGDVRAVELIRAAVEAGRRVVVDNRALLLEFELLA